MRNPRIQLMVQLFTLIIIMVSLIKHELFVSSSLVVALVLILFIGIPHGANDHLLFFNLIKKSADKKTKKGTIFFASYIGLIFLYIGCYYNQRSFIINHLLLI